MKGENIGPVLGAVLVAVLVTLIRALSRQKNPRVMGRPDCNAETQRATKFRTIRKFFLDDTGYCRKVGKPRAIRWSPFLHWGPRGLESRAHPAVQVWAGEAT